MTPEAYMKRFHSDVEDAYCPLIPEELYPDYQAVPVQAGSGCGSAQPAAETGGSCCCKGSMADALRLLCGEGVGSLVDFDAFFFLTDALAVGSTLAVPAAGADNIDAPAASLRRFSPCNCDLLDITGTAYLNTPGATTALLENVDQLSLCAVKAAAFQISEAACERECGDSNYDRAIRAIRRAIQAEGGDTGACGRCGAHCDCDDCCCDEGLLTELATRNLSRLATLAAGPLVLQNVSVLGSVGSVLVLADEALSRIYLVCANAVDVLG